MKQLEQLLASWPILGISLLLSMVVVAAAAVLVHVGTRKRLELMWAFFVLTPVSMVVGVVVQNRVLTIESFLGASLPDIDDYIASNWASRAITLICLAIALERLLRFLLGLEFKRARGLPLLAALLVYIAAVNVVSAFFGTVARFSHHLLYAPLFAVALFAYAQTGSERCVVVVRNVMLVFLVVSLGGLAVNLPMVAETNYMTGLVPGAKLRFYGFATHPNTLAPLCFLLMCCLFLKPFRAIWLQRFAWAVAWLCLLLTQSKTSVVIVVVTVAVLTLVRQKRLAWERGHAVVTVLTQRAVAATVVALGVIGLAVLVATLVEPKFSDRLARFGSNVQLVSLTGRTTIWSQTLRAVEANPLFGYGPGLWGPEFRVKSGLYFTHAHNQYLQTLGAAGIVGLLALVAYLAALLATAWRTRAQTQGVGVALAVYFVIRGITEVPLGMATAMQGEFLLQMFLLVLCVGALPDRQASAASIARQGAAPMTPGPGPARAVAGS